MNSIYRKHCIRVALIGLLTLTPVNYATAAQGWSDWLLKKYEWIMGFTEEKPEKDIISPILAASVVGIGLAVIAYKWLRKNPETFKSIPAVSFVSSGARADQRFRSAQSEDHDLPMLEIEAPTTDSIFPSETKISSSKSSEIFALFDGGQSSLNIADRLKTLVPLIFSNTIQYLSLEETLKYIFKECNDTIKDISSTEFSTAVVFAIKDGKGCFANVGDCEGYLIRDNSITLKTVSHTTEVPAEKIGFNARMRKIDPKLPQNDTIHATRMIGGNAFKGILDTPSIVPIGTVRKGDMIVLINKGISRFLSLQTILNKATEKVKMPSVIAHELVKEATNAQEKRHMAINTSALVIQFN